MRPLGRQSRAVGLMFPRAESAASNVGKAANDRAIDGASSIWLDWRGNRKKQRGCAGPPAVTQRLTAPIGRQRSTTARLGVSEKGLHFRTLEPNTFSLLIGSDKFDSRFFQCSFDRIQRASARVRIPSLDPGDRIESYYRSVGQFLLCPA